MNKVVFFYSDYCKPCQAIGPVVEKLLEEKEIYLEKVCIDTDSGSKHAEVYAVHGWPTLFAIQDDVIIAEMMGADPSGTEEQHRERIEKELLSKF